MSSFSIAFVCTGNRFRSPLAEAFVRRLTLGLPVTVRSFGILDLGAAPALEEAVELGMWCGVDLGGHRARALQAESLAETDLVLGFSENHVRRAVVDAGAPSDRTFSLTELVRLLDRVELHPAEAPISRARDAVARASAHRRAQERTRGGGEIRDPFGRSWKIYRETCTEIRSQSIALVAALFGVPDAGGLPPMPPRLRRPRAVRRR